jgi:hypothetical protein
MPSYCGPFWWQEIRDWRIGSWRLEVKELKILAIRTYLWYNWVGTRNIMHLEATKWVQDCSEMGLYIS